MTSMNIEPSYSRVCLVQLCHDKDPSRTIKGIAIIDEQSTSTLVVPEVVEELEIPEEDCKDVSYYLTTMEALSSSKQGREISGIMVSPCFDVDSPAEFPRMLDRAVIESEHIPPIEDELPIKREVEQISEFESLKDYFPEQRQGLDTIMLIGRDNMWAI